MRRGSGTDPHACRGVPRRLVALVGDVRARAERKPRGDRRGAGACGGVAQISDERGDGHHPNSDVARRWFSEAGRALQAVIQTSFGELGARPRGLRSRRLRDAVRRRRADALRPPRHAPARRRAARLRLRDVDQATGFVSAGATTGEVVAGVARQRHDRRPGRDRRRRRGAARAAVRHDLRRRLRARAALGRPCARRRERGHPERSRVRRRLRRRIVPAAGGGGPATGGGGTPAVAVVTTTAVVLDAPKRLVGGGKLRASGRVVPARGGVPVRLTLKPRRKSTAAIVRTRRTRADGTYAYDFQAVETSLVDAVAEGVNAQTRTVDRAVDRVDEGAPAAQRQDGRQRQGRAAHSGSRAAAARERLRPDRHDNASPRAACVQGPPSVTAAATRSCSSRPARAPSGPHPSQEPSDEAAPHIQSRRRGGRRRGARRPGRPRRRTRRST